MSFGKSKLGEQSRLVKEATEPLYNGPLREARPELDGESLIEVGNKVAGGQVEERTFEVARVIDGIKAEIVLREDDEAKRRVAQNFLFKLKKNLKGE